MLLIDQLLILVSRRHGDPSRLAVSVGISQEKIDTVLSQAIKIELDSDFDFYKTFWASNDTFIKKPISTKSNENVLESKRLSALFNKIEPYRDEQIALTITAWKTAYSPKQNGWRFSNLAELFNFIEGLTLLGIGNSSFELLIPQTITLPEDIIERLSSLCQITTIDASPNLTNHAILQYITLKVDKLPKEWKTTQTLNRMLFCLAVRFELDLENS